jgi:glutaredoxin-like protein
VSIITKEDAALLKKVFAGEMQKGITVLLFTRMDEPASEEARKLLEEVSALSDKITLKVFDFDKAFEEVKRYSIARAPAVTILGAKDHGIRYYGVPIEQEFETLIEWILRVSTGRGSLKEETVRELEKLDEMKKLTVLVTYACPHCPGVAQRAIDFAIASDKVLVDIIDIFEFPEVKKDFPVLVSTPKVFAGNRTLTGSRGSNEASLIELIK